MVGDFITDVAMMFFALGLILVFGSFIFVVILLPAVILGSMFGVVGMAVGSLLGLVLIGAML